MEEIKNASVTTNKDDYTEESMLFTFSEEEMEENAINRENAKLVFSPEFIPFYRNIQERFELKDTETLIYGFIRFYKTKLSGRFYFTDEQLAKVVGCHKDTAQEAVSSLKRKGLIRCGHKIKAGGGTIRFVTQVLIPVGENAVLPMGENTPFGIGENTPFGIGENTPSNNNKINKNIDKSIGDISLKEKNNNYGNKELLILKDILIRKYPVEIVGITNTRELHNLKQVCSPRKGKDEWMNPYWRDNFEKFLKEYLSITDQKYLVRSVKKLKDRVKDWRERGGVSKELDEVKRPKL